MNIPTPRLVWPFMAFSPGDGIDPQPVVQPQHPRSLGTQQLFVDLWRPGRFLFILPWDNWDVKPLINGDPWWWQWQVKRDNNQQPPPPESVKARVTSFWMDPSKDRVAPKATISPSATTGSTVQTGLGTARICFCRGRLKQIPSCLCSTILIGAATTKEQL